MIKANTLLNWDDLKKEVQRLQARVTRNGNRFTIFIIDLDHFECIYDRYGLGKGDTIFLEVATRILRIIRPGDIFGRIGGDGFILLVEISEVEEAAYIADRILAEFKEPIKFSNAIIQITLSVGLCMYPDDTDDPETLLQMADHTMYQNKLKGKWLMSQNMEDACEESIALVHMSHA